MRILALGAGGFFGRHILAAGHEVVGVARSTQALAAAFPLPSLAPSSGSTVSRRFSGDLRDTKCNKTPTSFPARVL